MVAYMKLLTYLKRRLGSSANMVLKECDWSKEGYRIVAEIEFNVPMAFILSVDEHGRDLPSKCQDCGTPIPEGHRWCEKCFTTNKREVI